MRITRGIIMQYLKNLGIGQKLIAGIIGLLVITSTAIGTLSFVQSSGALQEQVEENIPLMAQDGARLVSRYIENYRIAVEGVASRDVIESMDWSRQRPALEKETERLGILGMGIIAPDGEARYPDGSTAQLGDRNYFRQAMNGRTAFSDIIISRVVNRPVFIAAAPIRNDRGHAGRFAGPAGRDTSQRNHG